MMQSKSKILIYTNIKAVFISHYRFYTNYSLRTCPVGFIGAKFGIGEHCQGRAGVSATFCRYPENRLENLVICSLERYPCDAQINPSRTVEKSVQIDPSRRKKIDPIVKIRLTP